MSLLLPELVLDRMPLPPRLLMTGVQPQLQVLQVSHHGCCNNAYLPIPAPVLFCNPFSAACILSAALLQCTCCTLFLLHVMV